MARISAETKAKIVQAYLEDSGITYKELGERFGVNHNSVSTIIRAELQAGNGVKPDRRKKTLPSVELSDDELDAKHREALEAQHPRTSDWMEHIKPLNARKRELEENVRHKQAEYDAARQELRDFMATLKQLMLGE